MQRSGRAPQHSPCTPILENPSAGAAGPSPASASALRLTEGAQRLLGWMWFALDGCLVNQCEAWHHLPDWPLLLSCRQGSSKTPEASPRGREGGPPWATFLDPGTPAPRVLHMGGWPRRHPEAYRSGKRSASPRPVQGSAPGSVALGGQLDRCDTFLNKRKTPPAPPRNVGGWQQKSERREEEDGEGSGMGAAGEGRLQLDVPASLRSLLAKDNACALVMTYVHA